MKNRKSAGPDCASSHDVWTLLGLEVPGTTTRQMRGV